jgi:hypothetical protein
VTLCNVRFNTGFCVCAGFGLYRILCFSRVRFIQDSVFLQGSVYTGFCVLAGFGLYRILCFCSVRYIQDSVVLQGSV